jgi:DNA-binding response OmpR family regulator
VSLAKHWGEHCFSLLASRAIFVGLKFNFHSELLPKFAAMKILLVEDEPALVETIVSYLNGHTLRCEVAVTVQSALEKIDLHTYDCILLDLMLPDGNGLQVLHHLKGAMRMEGVIILSAKETLESRIEALQLGADDYLTKPFHLAELLVRIQALVRRKQFSGQNQLIRDEVRIDILAKEVFVLEKQVDLTPKELDLLLFLVGNENSVLSKAAIAEHLSGDMADMLDNHDFVYAHMKNLKKKLNEAGCHDAIKTVYGLGYKWQNG